MISGRYTSELKRLSAVIKWISRVFSRVDFQNHIMENILYNDLIRRGFDVDVGVVEYNTRDEDEKNTQTA